MMGTTLSSLCSNVFLWHRRAGYDHATSQALTWSLYEDIGAALIFGEQEHCVIYILKEVDGCIGVKGPLTLQEHKDYAAQSPTHLGSAKILHRYLIVANADQIIPSGIIYDHVIYVPEWMRRPGAAVAGQNDTVFP